MNKPHSVNVEQLSAAVKDAVSKVKGSNAQFHPGPGLIIGFIAPKTESVAELERAAGDVAAKIHGAQPTVLISGGHIICGFVAERVLGAGQL